MQVYIVPSKVRVKKRVTYCNYILYLRTFYLLNGKRSKKVRRYTLDIEKTHT